MDLSTTYILGAVITAGLLFNVDFKDNHEKESKLSMFVTSAIIMILFVAFWPIVWIAAFSKLLKRKMQ